MNRSSSGKASGTFRLRPRFLSVSGLIFYRALSNAVGDRVAICCNVKLSQIISPQKTLSAIEQQNALDNISNIHVDFLLCSPTDFTALAAIQTIDPGRPSLSEISFRQTLDDACSSAHLPLFRFEYQHEYDKEMFITELNTILPDNRKSGFRNTHLAGVRAINDQEEAVIELPHTDTQRIPDKTVKQHVEAEKVKAKPCPKCKKPLAVRTAKSGKNKGARYLICSDYPVCNFIAQLKAAPES